jgi:hypothetical protein
MKKLTSIKKLSDKHPPNTKGKKRLAEARADFPKLSLKGLELAAKLAGMSPETDQKPAKD